MCTYTDACTLTYHTYTQKHACTHMFTHINIYTHMDARVHTYIHTYACMSTHTTHTLTHTCPNNNHTSGNHIIKQHEALVSG